jgi:hypothetical protein
VWLHFPCIFPAYTATKLTPKLYFIPFSPNILLSTFSSGTCNLCSYLNTRYQFHTHTHTHTNLVTLLLPGTSTLIFSVFQNIWLPEFTYVTNLLQTSFIFVSVVRHSQVIYYTQICYRFVVDFSFMSYSYI